MKLHPLTFLLILIVVSCRNTSDNRVRQKKPATPVASIPVKNENEVSDQESEYELNYIVSLASGYNYDSLRTVAREASELLHYKFDTLDRYYDPSKKKIVLPVDYEDDIWAGDYYPRRAGGQIVSIEMCDAYIDTLTEKNTSASKKFYADSLRMMVFADMNVDKAKAEKLLMVVKPVFKSAAIIPAKVFMGCMH